MNEGRAFGRGPSLTTSLRELRRAIGRRRRLLSAGLMAGSMAFAISALAPAAPPTVTVLAAAHDLEGGAAVEASDLRAVTLPAGAVPDGVASDAARLLGRVLAAPVRAGEPITDVRLIGASLLAGSGHRMVAAPVRMADAESARLLRPGDAIDVLATELTAETGASGARLVAAGVRVVVVPDAGESSLGGTGFGEGALVVLATTSETAARLASAAVTSRLSLTIRGE